YSRISGTGAPWSRRSVLLVSPSASLRRRRSSDAKAGLGASGTGGSASASKGSVVIVGSLVVAGTECPPGAHEQRFGRVHGSAEMVGDLGHGEAVEVAKGEC